VGAGVGGLLLYCVVTMQFVMFVVGSERCFHDLTSSKNIKRSNVERKATCHS
jgi:hypothetical protein